MTELDEAMVGRMAALVRQHHRTHVRQPNSTRPTRKTFHQGDNEAAQAILTAILPDLREQHYAKCTAGIVAWLKDQWDRGELVCGDELADAIDCGDHITKEGE